MKIPHYPRYTLILQDQERRLPQHNLDLPYPEGRSAKMLRFGNQMWGVGFNNQLQETLLNTHIAYLSKRTYVFTPFTWDLNDEPFVPIASDSHLADSPYKVRPARVPLTAYINSPTTGSPWPPGDPAPRSVSVEWWDHVCPESERLHINTTEVNAQIGVDFDEDEGIDIVEKWVKYIRSIEHRCINILWATPRIIDFKLLGSERLISLWPTYSKSPVLTHFAWSPIVLSAVERNLPALTPRISHLTRWLSVDKLSHIPGLLTLHLRRGDYKHHCEWMSTFADFEGWNRLPFLPDPWNAPSDPADRVQYALNRCWIEIDDVVKRLDKLREEHLDANLDKIFVSTNGTPEWLEELKKRLWAKGWRSVVTTRDLKLSWQERGVDNAVDMELAARGEVFVANGYSSFSSTVVRIRMVRGLPPKNTRMW
ncbi:hypothetical protein BS47DRAFT_1321678 [Hydnum rufescens UP504]|uniref:O-fucosyltransferase family protein n=1 Tax=Hydnum rufescens UP504 TaxID=1448309 RepID=A0A9P6DL88_9AGAM|nr:hypothetical protein BS47DRAFT_1321678 [Hydnum rufescens UP504]